MAVRAALQRSVVSPAGSHRASVILLHGSGDTGPGVRAWIKQVLNQDLVFQHIKVIYPTAPARPYTPMRGALSTVWFDRWKISNECPEHIETIDSMCQVLTNVIDDEVKNGISKNRIILDAGDAVPKRKFPAGEDQAVFAQVLSWGFQRGWYKEVFPWEVAWQCI
uniref:palmitoyl-protein hydrolase n=1 Tax=Chrysemys picta bellii TaxID=8478 RepID=A0A8C3P4Z8_CHRPI